MHHTKEPWPEPQADTLETYTINGVGHFDSQADAERARNCVNAMAVIERRGWGVVKGETGWYAVDSDGNGIEDYMTPDWPDPATALIEAGKVFESKKGNNQ